jgi:hypothetical protein
MSFMAEKSPRSVRKTDVFTTVFQDLGCLGGYVAVDELAGIGFEGDLAGAEEELSGGDGLGVRADSTWGVGGGDDDS